MVAAAMREAIIHSSSRSRIRLSTASAPYANATDESGSGLWRCEPRGFVNSLDEILAETGLHFRMNRHQFGDPGLPLRFGQHVHLGLARGLDLVHRVGVILLGRRVEEFGRLLHGAIKLF